MIRGRVPSETWKRLIGVPVLPVLQANTRLARLIMEEAHQVGHWCEVGALLAQSRRKAWIVGGRRLARAVIASCLVCRREGRKVQQQVMGDMKKEHLATGRREGQTAE